MIEGVLYVDSRVGSRELAPLLQKRGHKVVVEQMPSADVAFLTAPGYFGRSDDRRCRIGVERKTVSDMAGSLLSSRFFEIQVPDMLDYYHSAWLVVEGLWRPGENDAIEVPMGGSWRPASFGLTYSQLSSWLVTYDHAGNGQLKRWRTSSMTETAVFISNLFRWHQKKWKDHKSYKTVERRNPAFAGLTRPTDLMVAARALRRVGNERCRQAASFFESIHDMINAEVDDWRRAGLGKKDAEAVYAAIRRQYRRRPR